MRWTVAACALLLSCTPARDSPPLAAYLDEIGFSGSVLVVHDDTELLRAGFGFADLELRVPNHPELVYRIGSLTKPITASAVVRAAEQGHFSLDDSICRRIPRCPSEWSDVEIRHLLNHTSGIPDYFGNLPEAPLLETTAEVDRLLAELVSRPLGSPGGTEYSYSNFNYVLLGYLLRLTTGSDWESFLRDEVLEPVGAFDTRYDDVWEVVPDRARGYGKQDGHLRNVEYGDHSAYAAGGLRSTVDDLRRWHEGLRDGQVFDPAMLPIVMSPSDGAYGYGWQIIRALGLELQNHTGGIDGFSSHLAWYPTERLLIILLSNVEDEPVKALACDVARLVLGIAPTPEPTADWQARATAERCGQEPL